MLLRTRWVAALATVMLLGVLVACGGEDEDPAEAQAQLCEDLSALQTSVNDLAALTPDSTIDQVEAAQESVQDAYADVESSAEDVEDARIDDLDTAVDNLDAAVGDIDDSQSIADAQASLQEEITAVQTAWTQLFESVDCTTT